MQPEGGGGGGGGGLEPQKGRVVIPDFSIYCQQRTYTVPDQLAELIHSMDGDAFEIKGRLVHWKMKKQARQSLQCQYPDDFVYRFVEGDGNDFDWALEFSECAVNKFYEKQGVAELKPYCNFFDVTYSRYLNMGIDASMTIGMGLFDLQIKVQKRQGN